MKFRNFFTAKLLNLFLLFLTSHLFAITPTSTIHLDLSSKKVPTKRSQLKIIFKAYTDYGSYNGRFSFYAPDSVLISSNYPEIFYFDENGFTGSFILQFQSDGFYRVYGNLNDYELLNSEVPEEVKICF